MKLNNFKEVDDYLRKTIPKKASKKYSGLKGLNRTKKLLGLLGNPQNKLKVIHVAGTNGKGSASYLISLLLEKHGFKTGLHLSPHLLDVRERCMVNNKLISEEKYVSYLNELIPKVEKLEETPTYFEITTTLAYYVFWKEKVDFAVMETGLGGTFDATNTVDRKTKLCVLTKIGLDHQKILGKTMEEIASWKAGIIQRGNTVVTLHQDIIEKKANEKNCELIIVNTPSNVVASEEFTSFDYKDKQIQLGLLGLHQAENCSLSLSAVQQVIDINWDIARKALRAASFPARLEIMKIDGKTVIVDGAHNPEKMKALVSSLKQIFPEKKFNFLVAFKKGKDCTGMLKEIKKAANTITITSFVMKGQDMPRLSENPKNIEGKYNIIKDSKEALKKLLEKDNLVITGSLYLLFELYPELQNLLKLT